MANKPIRPLRSDAEYKLALAKISRCADQDSARGPAPELLDTLTRIIEDYERKRWPVAVRATRPRSGYSSFSVVK